MKEDDGLTVREITAGGTQMLASNSSSHVIKLNLITDDIISIFSIYILCDITQAYILFPVNSRPIFGETEKSITVISAALSVMGGDCGFNTGPCSVSKLLSPLSLFFR